MECSYTKIKAPKKITGSLLLIGFGVILLLAGAIVLLEPYYTLAREETESRPGALEVSPPGALFEMENMSPGDSATGMLSVTNTGAETAYLWLKLERVDGDPPTGEPGDLYSQMLLEITWRDITIYRGPMDGLEEQINISERNGPLRPGQEMELAITAHLPGPPTGNEFQGSTLNTRFVFYTQYGQAVEVPPEEPGISPERDHPPACGYFSLLLLLILLIICMIIREITRRREKKRKLDQSSS